MQHIRSTTKNKNIHNLTMHKNIWGWFNSSQQTVYDIFAEQCEPGDNILEIGALLGKSTCYLAEQLISKKKHDIHLYVVDIWKTETCTSSPKYQQEIMQKYGPDLYPHFEQNLKQAGCWDIIQPLQMTSNEAFEQLTKQNIKFKFTFIDGDHSYEQCHKDIANFKQLTTNIIAGDDFKGGGGVKQAVEKVFGDTGYQLVGDPLYPAWFVKIKKN